MQTETVTCGGCGAPLTIPENVEYVSCKFCHAQLHVQRNQSVVFTEVMKSLQQQTERLADNTEVLRIQNEIALLDREWEQQSAGLMVHGKHGSVSVPDKTSTVLVGIFVVAFGLMWTCIAGVMFPPFALFGILFVAIAMWNIIKQHNNAGRYAELQAAHEIKRNKLRRQLDALGQ